MNRVRIITYGCLILLLAGEAAASQLLPNVILISVDALRPDHISYYGHACRITPNIDRMAERGIAFTDASTSIPLTNPSMATLFTSMAPYQTGANRNGIPLPPENETLMRILRENLYTTAAVPGCWALNHSRSGMDRDFDYYKDRLTNLIISIDARMVTRRAQKLLESGLKEPFLLWLHYSDCHQPHFFHPSYSIRFQGCAAQISAPVKTCYMSEVAYADHWLGVFLDELEERGLLDRSLVIILADHGESLGEKNYYGHGRRLYQKILQVPLIISGTGLPAGKKIGFPVQIQDVTPTIMAYLGLEPGSTMQGRNLLPTILHDQPLEPLEMYFETHSVAFLDIPVFRKILQEPEPVSIALRVDNFKVIYNFHKKSWEMYNLDEDPEEQHNLFDSDEPQWRLLASKLWEWYRKRDTFEADQIQIELDIDTDESSSF